MPIAWTDSLTLRLVIFYSKHECLRNPFHPDYKNKRCRYKAYKEIVDSMDVCCLTVYDCIKRITCVKAQYCYELSKISAAISCEKFYRPIANWFPIIHELFFPFIPTYNCTSDCCKICSDKTGTHESYDYKETQEQSTRPVPAEPRALSTDCGCPYETCYCDKSNIAKPHTRLRKAEKPPSFLAEEKGVTTSQTTARDCKYYLHQQKVSQIDVGSNIRSIRTEHATQSELSYFKTACTACQVCMENEVPFNLMKKDLKETDISYTDCAPPVKDIKGRTKTDEFDMFGKSVAFQLRNISFEIAVKLEKRIQDIIAQERLDHMKLKYLDCCTASSCSECAVLRKEMVCSCGLPVIMIKADSSCDLDCKQRI
ncbi:uncharacterized protein LOC126924697 isoform X1 [Bombus affinis]|uniref:uncharacterized protein LOC126924697 isoform X1 n=1 Tax=Bombus affinis TaxID=309941 RepID=UPI0021B7C3B6|nr:uncharacterized protein LOC126924697 isoform X1 [Bombus affinis]